MKTPPIFAFAVMASMAFAPAAKADTLPFIGTWDCEVATFTFTDSVYNNGSEDMPIEEVQEGSDGSYSLLFADDYVITLSGFKRNSMNWFSSASGDSFSCKRVGRQ